MVCLSWGCENPVPSTPPDSGGQPERGEPNLIESDAGRSIVDAKSPPYEPECYPCPASMPLLGTKCSTMSFCEYAVDGSTTGVLCTETCNGAHWDTVLVPDAGSPEGGSQCPSERPLIGSACDAGPVQCDLGFTLYWVIIGQTCKARRYVCACGQWTLAPECNYYGPPPPC